MEAEVIEKLECEVDSLLMKLNKDQLIEIAAGISLDKTHYENESKLNLKKHIDGQKDTLQYELLSKLQNVRVSGCEICKKSVCPKITRVKFLNCIL